MYLVYQKIKIKSPALIIKDRAQKVPFLFQVKLRAFYIILFLESNLLRVIYM